MLFIGLFCRALLWGSLLFVLIAAVDTVGHEQLLQVRALFCLLAHPLPSSANPLLPSFHHPNEAYISYKGALYARKDHVPGE